MKAQKKISGFWLLAAVSFTAFLVYASLTSVKNLPASELFGYDKLLHFSAYAAEMFLLAKAFVKKLYIDLLTIAIGCIILGISLEWLQGVMRQGRAFEYLDMAANVLGVSFGSFVYLKQLKL